MTVFEILKEANQQATYNVLRTSPDSDDNYLTHSEVCDVLKLSEGKGAYYQACFEGERE